VLPGLAELHVQVVQQDIMQEALEEHLHLDHPLLFPQLVVLVVLVVWFIQVVLVEQDLRVILISADRPGVRGGYPKAHQAQEEAVLWGVLVFLQEYSMVEAEEVHLGLIQALLE